MVVPANTQTAVSLAANFREDLSAVVNKLEPLDNAFQTNAKRVKADKEYHEWLTDSLRPAVDNAKIDGQDVDADARTPRPRLGNRVQYFANAVRLSHGAQAGNTAEGKKQLAIEIAKELKSHKQDIELSLTINQAAVAGDGATVASRLAGIQAWLKTNTVLAAGAVDPTGDGTDTRTAAPAAADFTEANLNECLQSIWREGGKATTVILSPEMLDVATAFTGNAPRREMKDAGKVNNYIDVYMTNWGEVEFMPHRLIASGSIFVIDSETLRIADYIKTKQEPLAKTGLSDTVMISTALTLEVGNEKRLGAIYDRQAPAA